jgi:hypothetical protein
LHLCKNSISDVLVLYISWIIIYANCIFSLYTLPSSHFEDDGECGGDLTTNGWIFNTPSHYVLFNSYSIFFFSTIFLPPISVCAHSSMLPSPLLLFAILQLHSMHSCFCEL